jgi:hypothetical protein
VPWERAALVWMLMMVAETVHGIARELFIAPVIGDLRARQIGVLVASLIVLAIAWASALWMGASTRRVQIIVGIFWVALTIVFEFSLGRAIGASWDRILSDYNPLRGGWMLLGLLVALTAPMLAASLRAKRRKELS